MRNCKNCNTVLSGMRRAHLCYECASKADVIQQMRNVKNCKDCGTELPKLRRNHRCYECVSKRETAKKVTDSENLKARLKEKGYSLEHESVTFLRGKMWRIKKKYGIEYTDYLDMYQKQEGLCVICEVSPAEVIDHCHVTGKVRSLLCSQCNSGIGCFKESVMFMEKAIEYIKTHNAT